jgi:hypothetical protein
MRLLPFSPRQQRDYRDDVIGVLVGSQYLFYALRTFGA